MPAAGFRRVDLNVVLRGTEKNGLPFDGSAFRLSGDNLGTVRPHRTDLRTGTLAAGDRLSAQLLFEVPTTPPPRSCRSRAAPGRSPWRFPGQRRRTPRRPTTPATATDPIRHWISTLHGGRQIMSNQVRKPGDGHSLTAARARRLAAGVVAGLVVAAAAAGPVSALYDTGCNGR